MKRITISVSDELYAMLSEDISKQKVSSYIATALERRLLEDRTSHLRLFKKDVLGLRTWMQLAGSHTLPLLNTENLLDALARGRQG